MTPLRFSFWFSIGVHALLISTLVLVGALSRKVEPAPEPEKEGMLVTLTAAPDEPESDAPNVPSPPIITQPLTPPQTPVSETPEPIPPKETQKSAEGLEPPVVIPTNAVESIPPPESASAPIPSNTGPTLMGKAPATARPRGDGSSTEPGTDSTTLQKSAGARAHADYRKNPEPAYPAAARRRRQEGVVLLAVRVSVQGKAAEVSVKTSSGFPLLDEAAVTAVRTWQFEPGRIDSKAVESEIEVPIRFKLTE